jgi:3-oxoacid CoA-transferase B subunit
MGGAMDLVAGVKRVVVLMDHMSKAGDPKLLKECSLPLTGVACVDRIVSSHAVFDVDKAAKKLKLIELAPEVTLDELRASTEAAFEA